MKNFLKWFDGTIVLLVLFLFGASAWAGFQGYNGATSLKLFNKIRCSTGLTCTRSGDLFTMVSSPVISVAGGFSIVSASEATDADLALSADEADDSGDSWIIRSQALANSLLFMNNVSGSFVGKLGIKTNGVLSLSSGETVGNTTDGTVQVLSNNTDMALNVLGFEASAAKLQLWADEGDDTTDKFELNATAGDVLEVMNGSSTIISFDSGGSIYGDGTDAMSGFLQSMVSVSAGSTIAAGDCGKSYLSFGAATINLPSAVAGLAGCRITFFTGAASTLNVNPGNSDSITLLTNAVGDSISNSTVGNSVVLQAVKLNVWMPVGKEQGTWADAN